MFTVLKSFYGTGRSKFLFEGDGLQTSREARFTRSSVRALKPTIGFDPFLTGFDQPGCTDARFQLFFP